MKLTNGDRLFFGLIAFCMSMIICAFAGVAFALDPSAILVMLPIGAGIGFLAFRYADQVDGWMERSS